MKLSQEQQQKLQNISSRIIKIYDGIECCNFKSSCLNSLRQSLEYLCMFTCEVYDIKITRLTKKGDVVENENPTLGDMAPLIEKHFKQINVLWSKEVDMHIGSIWIVGNLGSHAQKELLETDSDISQVTIENALNSMYIVTKWFYELFEIECPIKPKSKHILSEKEQEVLNKSNTFYQKLAILKQKNDEKNLVEEQENNNNKFSDIYFEDLLEAIELGLCVLFIGPDLSVDEEGDILHEKFYKSISQRNIEYNEEDGFFMPKAEKQIELKALNYYGNKFHKENTVGRRILEKITQIPFSLIVSVTPDDTMHKIYDDYQINHNFVYYNSRTKQQTNEPTKAQPVIFNMLGNTAIDGKYIFTHKQFYDYINQNKEVKLPFEIENKINNVAHYLFIGLDFNKWYNRLLLFALNLYDEAEAYSFETNLKEINKAFVSKQFNITFIENNYEEFVDVLLSKCKKVNISQNLIDIFIKNTTEAISKISKELKPEEIDKKLNEFEEKINSKLNQFDN